MKTNTIKSLSLLVILLAMVFLSSCQDDEKSSTADNTAKKEKVEKVLAFREDVNFINRFVDDNVMYAPSEEGRSSFTRTTIARLQNLAPCSDVVEEELEDGSIKITLNFGEGCETEEGVEVAGSVVMIFSFNDTALEYELEFTDYTEISSGEYQGQLVNGTVIGSFVLDLEASTFNQTMEQDLTITYANNQIAGYKVVQASELTENGLRVTQLSTSGNFADGGQFAITLNKSLVYDFSCEGNLPVQGEEVMSFQGNMVKVSYGNGTCDNEYTVK